MGSFTMSCIFNLALAICWANLGNTVGVVAHVGLAMIFWIGAAVMGELNV